MIDKTVKKKALSLSESDRAELAHFLIDSLESNTDYKSKEAWSKEIKYRINQYEKDKSTTKSWNEVKNNAREKLL